MESLLDFGEVIYTYTRQQAIEDGVLIDVSQTAMEVGFRYPVAVTQAVWTELITPDEADRTQGQSETGRLWDVLWMCYLAARRSRAQSQIMFSVEAVRGNHRETVKLKALCHPGDRGEPVVTIMLPDED
ncbi:DUF6573 family protein [Desulforamulus putei]|uniref:Uncharacterized protein n=1 Tax=Desulforamulus putei DSM 12395 TaxID=1121429 RepID=A0A1M5A7L8_9FIRM|nr:DUF6573 family protein [Desulforamulus putei]SHF26164.1 hypothetical protein SAMN02745133_02200 [Desulforamulus putei DSM 12395]